MRPSMFRLSLNNVSVTTTCTSSEVEYQMRPPRQLGTGPIPSESDIQDIRFRQPHTFATTQEHTTDINKVIPTQKHPSSQILNISHDSSLANEPPQGSLQPHCCRISRLFTRVSSMDSLKTVTLNVVLLAMRLTRAGCHTCFLFVSSEQFRHGVLK